MAGNIIHLLPCYAVSLQLLCGRSVLTSLLQAWLSWL
jgi:hypothetical protein